jgi:hypothetical protein
MSDSPVKLPKAWSISRLHVYDKCPHAYYLKHVVKWPMTAEMLERSQKYADRGSAIHLGAEDFIQGNREDIISELLVFTPHLHAIREKFGKGKAVVEQDWGFKRDWTPCEWSDPDLWLRMKLDVSLELGAGHGYVGDWKSGKKVGNEIKHSEQLALYAHGKFSRDPKLTDVEAELLYTDQEEITHIPYSRTKAKIVASSIANRAVIMLADTTFRPRANIFSCQWCDYRRESDGGAGGCDHAISTQVIPPKFLPKKRS